MKKQITTSLTRRLYKMGFAVVLLAVSGGFLAACNQKQPSAQAKVDAKAETTVVAKRGAKTRGEVIRIGVDSDYPPVAFRSGGKLVGFDIDLANEAFKRLGFKRDFLDIHWDTKDRQLNQDKTIDVIWSGFNVSPERRQVYDFTESYMSDQQVVIVLEDSPIQTLADLSGKTVAVQEGSSLIPKLQAIGNVTVKDTYPEYATELVAVNTGEVDASAMGSVAAAYYLKNTPGKFRVLSEDLGETLFAVAVRKGDKELLDKLNKVIDEMKADGTVQRLQSQWFK